MVEERRIRSREFLRFAKGMGGVCCICRNVHGESVYGEELHHFGDKGMSQKGSDFRVARVCVKHHKQYQGKRAMAFFRDGELEIYNAMLTDSIEMTSAYAAYVEEQAKKPFAKMIESFLKEPEGCARAEMQEWLLQNAPEAFEDGKIEWMLKWSNRRAGNVLEFLIAPMLEISRAADEDYSIEDVVFTAKMALKRCLL